jgi:hypothetical protein
VYYPNGNIYKIGGIVQKFCQQSIRGGRCMTAKNKSWHIFTPILDFDAKSLYPASMTRLYVVEGKPEVVPEELKNYDDLVTNSTAFIVEIKITGIKNHYSFPLLSAYDKVNNSMVLNWCDENLMVGRKIVVNDITLEDLIKFQGTEFEIIRGYLWTGKKDYRIRDLVIRLFELRKKYQNDKDENGNSNPLETVYKL